MSTKLLVFVILVCTFIGSFLLMTDLLDQFDKSQGVYTEGQQAEKELYAEWN